MASKIYFNEIVNSLAGKRHLRIGFILLILVTVTTRQSFGQIGPYFYGKPNPSTLVPDPPSPPSDYYTLGLNEGLPKYLDSTVDQVNPPSNPQFLKQLIAALPDRVDRSNNLGVGGVADLTVIDDSSEVFLVFLTEGANSRNALGYYIYKGDIAPNDLNIPNPLVPGKTYLESRRIIFPNTSMQGNSIYESGDGGGRLVPGNRVKLIGDLPNGNFSKDIHIAWFIVSNAWDGTKVGKGLGVLYSNPELNPRKFRQAAILDFSATEGRKIITFEDRSRAPEVGSDSDFNDVVFYISQKVEGGQTAYYPDCSGKLVLTKEEYNQLPKDQNGKLVCGVNPLPVTNLSLTAICSNNPTQQLAWRVTNPNTNKRPFTWVITDGVTNNVKLASTAVLDALPGDNIIYTNPVSGTNAMTLSVEGTVQPNGTKVMANTVACEVAPSISTLTCCVAFASEVISYNPGTTRTGNTLPAERKNASQSLGESGLAGSFVALGFNGGTPANEASIVLKFVKPVRGFVNIYETTFGPAMANFVETAEIYGSLDGNTYYRIGIANNQEKGSVDIHRTTLELKGEYAQIQYLKIVDATPKSTMPDDADGFDLGAVCASDFALETVAFNSNAQPGTVKIDKDKTVAHQAKQKNGNPVWSGNPNVNSDPSCAQAGLCDPEGINRSDVNSILARDNAFFSLGLGGSIEIEFKELVSGSLILYERTGDPKPAGGSGSINYVEKVAVYVKTADCNEWGAPIGYADNQGSQLGNSNGTFDHQTYKTVVSLGGRTVKYVKLVDITPGESTSTDGYDLDFIASTANASSQSGQQASIPEVTEPNAASLAGMVITAFPNPSTGNLTLDFGYRETGYMSAEPIVVTVSDLMGNVVMNVLREADSPGEMHLNLQNQKSGMYFLSVREGNTVTNKKIYLQR